MQMRAGSTDDLSIDWGATGATLGVRVLDNQGATTIARATGFVEQPAGSGIYYLADFTAPDDRGRYTLVYDDDGGTAALGHVATEDLIVTSTAVGSPAAGDMYATVEELARLLKVSAATYEDQLTEVLVAAAGEINSEIGLTEDSDPLELDWQIALATQVNLERAEEHWKQRQMSFGIFGLDSEGPIRLAQDTWRRHAFKLSPLKQSWGFS